MYRAICSFWIKRSIKWIARRECVFSCWRCLWSVITNDRFEGSVKGFEHVRLFKWRPPAIRKIKPVYVENWLHPRRSGYELPLVTQVLLLRVAKLNSLSVKPQMWNSVNRRGEIVHFRLRAYRRNDLHLNPEIYSNNPLKPAICSFCYPDLELLTWSSQV